MEASTTEECSTWIESLIEFKTTKTLNVHKSAAKETKPVRVIKLWQIDNVVGSIRLAKYSIPEGKDSGVMLMDDLIPLDDEIGFESFRDSLSMSSVGSTNSASFERASYMKSSFRDRGDSTGLPPTSQTNSSRVASRSKSVTSSSSHPPAIEDLQLFELNTKPSKESIDVFAGEMLVPTPGPLDPPRLHSVWSSDFEDVTTQGSHKSLPRPVSSPDVRNSAGLLDLMGTGCSPHSSVNFESAFIKGSPHSRPPSQSRSIDGGSSTSSNGHLSTHAKSLSNSSSQQLSFAEEDALFDFLTSVPPQPSSSSNAASHPRRPTDQPSRQSTKKLVLDQDKFILGRK